jgi:hypothetical protein
MLDQALVNVTITPTMTKLNNSICSRHTLSFCCMTINEREIIKTSGFFFEIIPEPMGVLKRPLVLEYFWAEQKNPKPVGEKICNKLLEISHFEGRGSLFIIYVIHSTYMKKWS